MERLSSVMSWLEDFNYYYYFIYFFYSKKALAHLSNFIAEEDEGKRKPHIGLDGITDL